MIDYHLFLLKTWWVMGRKIDLFGTDERLFEWPSVRGSQSRNRNLENHRANQNTVRTTFC